MESESKPLGEINHYISKEEWQSRLSEHVHFLFWTKDGIPSLKLEENGELKGYQETIIDKAEAHASSVIHLYPLTTDSFGKQIRDEYTDECYKLNQNNALYERQGLRPLSTEDAIRSVTQEPIAFKEYFINNIARKSVNNLVRSVSILTCSTYCPKKGTTTCKSRFPFKRTDQTVVKRIIDKNLNSSYRIQLRRNHSRVNPYSVPILNFWRAKMDLTVLYGSPFASKVYVTYYTSKLDKKADIRDVLQKIKTLDEETDAKAGLRKILTTMDTCRATGLPEASANLLLYPHRYTSSKIFRLDTRSYLPPGELPDKLTLNVLTPLLHEATKQNDEFEIPSPEYSLNLSKQRTLDNITKNYFNRPQ